MLAIRVDGPGKLDVVEMDKPKIGNPWEVLVKVTSGSICGSDLGIFKGTNALAEYPAVIGHEYGGIVEEVGGLVTALKAGDLVAVDPVRPCGHCYPCTHGRQNVCGNLKVCGVHLPGGFAEYVTAPADRAHKVNPAKIPADMVCLVEPYSIGVQVNKRGRIAKNDLVLVMGCGPAGLCIMQDAKARGAEVVMTDILDARLEEAKRMGADRVVNVRENDLRRVVDEMTGGAGMPVVIDAVCSVQSFPQSLDLACAAGRVLVLGLSNAPSEIPSLAITKKELDVIGTRLNNRRFPEVIASMERGFYSPERLRTHVFPLAKAREAFDLVLNHPEQVRKVVLTFS